MDYILNVKKAKRRTFCVVFDGFGGKGLVFSVQKVKLAENVREVGRDIAYIDYDYAKFK